MPFKRVIITGGAGFIGSHLIDRLLAAGTDVVCFDNFSTGRLGNLRSAQRAGARLDVRTIDVTDEFEVEGLADAVLHLASPASPADYLRLPLETMRVGSFGTFHALELARRHNARFLLASTSEVYGDPLVHPQPEGYWGNVNPIGPRSVYDESKRYAEALTMAYRRTHGLNTTIARIFNTFGPRMRRNDGRAIPAFIDQALTGRPLTVAGSGTQTRSFCFVEDTVEGLLRLVASDLPGPINVGNPQELTVRALAELVRLLTRSESDLAFVDLPADDPQLRRPDITEARTQLGWEPRVSLEDGLERTIAWFRKTVALAPADLA